MLVAKSCRFHFARRPVELFRQTQTFLARHRPQRRYLFRTWCFVGEHNESLVEKSPVSNSQRGVSATKRGIHRRDAENAKSFRNRTKHQSRFQKTLRVLCVSAVEPPCPRGALQRNWGLVVQCHWNWVEPLQTAGKTNFKHRGVLRD